MSYNNWVLPTSKHRVTPTVENNALPTLKGWKRHGFDPITKTKINFIMIFTSGKQKSTCFVQTNEFKMRKSISHQNNSHKNKTHQVNQPKCEITLEIKMK